MAATDPVLALRGLGKALWTVEPGDLFIGRLREEEAETDGEEISVQCPPTP